MVMACCSPATHSLVQRRFGFTRPQTGTCSGLQPAVRFIASRRRVHLVFTCPAMHRSSLSLAQTFHRELTEIRLHRLFFF